MDEPPVGWTRYAPPDETLGRYRSGEAVVRSLAIPGGEVVLPLARRRNGANRLSTSSGPLLHYASDGVELDFEGWWRSGLGRFDPLVPELVFGNLCLTLPGPARMVVANPLTGTEDGVSVGATGRLELRLVRADVERIEASLVATGLPVIRLDGERLTETVDVEVSLWAAAAR